MSALMWGVDVHNGSLPPHVERREGAKGWGVGRQRESGGGREKEREKEREGGGGKMRVREKETFLKDSKTWLTISICWSPYEMRLPDSQL